MARVTIDFPENVLFTTEIAVRVSDLNYGGHVGNDSVLTLMQEARVLFYRHLGFESEIHLDGSIGQIIADASIVYQSESFLGDILSISIAISDFNKYGFSMYYRITQKTNGKAVAIGKTGIVCFDYEKRKIASIPEAFRRKLAP